MEDEQSPTKSAVTKLYYKNFSNSNELKKQVSPNTPQMPMPMGSQKLYYIP